MHSSRTTHMKMRRQRGVAFIVMLVIMVVGITAYFVSSLGSAALQIKRDQVTANALVQAKEALIGYAASVTIDSNVCAAGGNNCKRLGDLPCPDINNDGVAEASCGNNVPVSNGQALRIGRLPWKTLGLPDLRDGSGERLWYAVSNNFKNNTRTTCTSPGQTGCLNSDTKGTISVFSSDGIIVNDGGGTTGGVAIIIAPGDALTRQDNISQTRGCTLGVDCDSTDKCTSASPTTVPKCNPVNYLDISTVSGQDNANFIDSSSSNGFIQGRIKDSNGNIIVNDQLLVITQDNIMQPIQKRVAAEVKLCLSEYASFNNGHYPWTTDPTNPTNYIDASNKRFGRIPDQPFINTKNDSGDNMNDVWGGNCNINPVSGWWVNWKEMVFFGISSAYQPMDPPDTPSCGSCLAVNPPSVAADKQFVVIVAGKMLPTQSRANSPSPDKGLLSNYLEGGNANGVSPFEQRHLSATFNDTVVFQ